MTAMITSPIKYSGFSFLKFLNLSPKSSVGSMPHPLNLSPKSSVGSMTHPLNPSPKSSIGSMPHPLNLSPKSSVGSAAHPLNLSPKSPVGSTAQPLNLPPNRPPKAPMTQFMRKLVGTALFVLLPLICLLLAALAPVSALSPERLVRVGFFPADGFNQNGVGDARSGYNYDYLQEIAQYTGWEYEFVEAPFNECLEMLGSGELDLMGGVQKTESTLERFAFSKTQEGFSYASIFVRADESRFAYEDFAAFNGMTVGLLEGGALTHMFRDYCRIHSFNVTELFFSSEEQLISALGKGTLDAILLRSVSSFPNVKLVARFSPSPFYFIAPKDNAALLSEVEQAIERIKSDNPYFESHLYDKYIGVRLHLTPNFTRSELNYIASAPTLRVLFDPNWPPFEFVDPQSGEISGSNVILFDSIAALSGLKFEYIKAQDPSNTLAEVSDGRAELAASISHDYAWADSHKVHLTRPYITAPVSMVYISGTNPPNERVALARGYFLSRRLLPSLATSDIHYYDTYSACFDALERGEVSCLYANSYVANYYLKLPKFFSFSVATLPGVTDEFSFAVSHRMNPLLVSVLNKSLLCIPAEAMNSSIFTYSTVENLRPFETFLYSKPLAILSATLIAALILIILLCALLFLRNRNRKNIEKLLYRDELTGLWNYKRFLSEAESLLEQASAPSFALVYMDMLHFKYINDTFGYEEGDRVLISVSHLLEDFIATGEAFARVYADHFVMLLKYSDKSAVGLRLERLAASLAELSEHMGGKYSFIFHCGVYLIDRPGASISVAVDRANYAMGSICAASTSRYVFYDNEMRSLIIREKELEALMRPALAKHEFLVFIQPKVDISDDSLIGAEALVRWKHPQRGLLSPVDFVPFFEKNGFITEIDMFVYRETCRILHSWIVRGLEVVPISCNFSRPHIQSPDFVSTIVSIADEFELEHSLIELEMTESIAMENLAPIAAVADELHKHGFAISIDDFGAGYSSLSLIQDLPVDIIKLDRAFVLGGMRGELESDLVKAVVDVAGKHGIRIICEGIETREQEDFIRSIGARFAQGFLYARPMTSDQFEWFL